MKVKCLLMLINDLGEIHSLAAARLLEASIICSNDYDIKEVIQDASIYVTSNGNRTHTLLRQDTLVDFCYYTIQENIEKSRVVHKFLSVIDSNKINELDRLLSS